MSEEKKFFGEMTKDEFKQALKIIFSSEEDEKKLSEKIKENWKNFIEKLKYIFTFKFVPDFFEWLKEVFKYIITFYWIKDFFCWIKDFFTNEDEDDESYWTKFIRFWKTPLTQDVFIQRGKKVKKAIAETIDTIVFVIVMVIIIRFFIGEIRWIPSGSMHPTLLEGDRIVVERYSRFYKTPKRGDVMVFYPPSTKLSNSPVKLFERLTGILCKDVAYIKRVIGVPGDKIEIIPEPDGRAFVYINDKKFEENYIKSPYDYPSCPDKRINPIFLASNQMMKCGPFQLDKDSYFMMGDNRGASYDSRYWGPLKKDRFIGRAVVIFWPFNRVKSLKRP